MNISRHTRLPPPLVENVSVDDLAYYLDNVRHQELPHSVTYLFAVDEQYDEIWRLPIYVTYFNEELDEEAQEIYPISLEYNSNDHAFVIKNESGASYIVDLSSLTVERKN